MLITFFFFFFDNANPYFTLTQSCWSVCLFLYIRFCSQSLFLLIRFSSFNPLDEKSDRNGFSFSLFRCVSLTLSVCLVLCLGSLRHSSTSKILLSMSLSLSFSMSFLFLSRFLHTNCVCVWYMEMLQYYNN